MSKFIKLPDTLKSWKINSLVSSENECEIYKVSKKDFDGTVINGLLRHISVHDDAYNQESIDFFEDEASFLKSVSDSGNCFVYTDIVSDNNPAKEKYDLYIVSEDSQTLADVLENTSFEENEIIEFGIQMSTVLELLESKNIFHGNINPSNIFVTADGNYKLGGFSDIEGKIGDLSYVAPEIYKKENADFTTDIYSLGIIMYSMCNNGRLPLENEATDKENAAKERISGKAVTAPQNGSEKLKSVIVIACQFNNGNRWKNAGNIKNALSSLRDSQTESLQKGNSAVIPPAPTDFDDNVFEEYEYDEFEETTPQQEDNIIESQDEVNSAENEQSEPENSAADDDESGYEIAEVTDAGSEQTQPEESKVEEDNTASDDSTNALDTIDDENVFDDFAVTTEKKSFKRISEERDYGNFFDDEPTDSAKAIEDAESTVDKAKEEVPDLSENEPEDSGYDDEFLSSGDNDVSGHRKRNTAIIIVCIVILLAVLGFIAYGVLNGFGGVDSKPTTAPASTAAETTKQPETKPSTAAVTTQPSTAAPTNTVISVVGYGYSYGKELLEQTGFETEISEYRYSTQYEDGYIIEQSPEGDTEAKAGSVVSLVVSSGLIEETTYEPESSEEQNGNTGTDDDFIFADSDSAYLSYAQIDALSDNELQLAINEIYARRGRIFNDQSLADYFNSKSWYEGIYTAEEFEQNVNFNTYEQKNLQLMIDERNTR